MVPEVYLFSDLSRLKYGVNKFFRIIAKDFRKTKVGIKIHFGEKGNDTHINPELLKDVKKFFPAVFVECNALYRGSRTVKKDHMAVAKEHGFGFLDIDILDGDIGDEFVEVPVNLKNIKKAKLGKGITKYNNLIAMSHFKGHIATGFGGALKNVGMGLGSRAGKLDMHSTVRIAVDSNKCTGCMTCEKNCPANAIKVINKKAEIDSNVCIGCARCIAVCPNRAVNMDWSGENTNRLMEKIAEYALAATKGRNWWYINFLTNITLDCDCASIKQKPLMKDVGILLSKDPVAIDQASVDLLKERNKGKDPFIEKGRIDGSQILKYAESIGLGKMDYELIKID